jgi:hypothetical protein
VHNIDFDGITFTGTTWTRPTPTGYIDNQSGVLWHPANRHRRSSPPQSRYTAATTVSFTTT